MAEKINNGYKYVKDARGEMVKIPQNPQRIISFICSITETLFDLELSDRLVGRTNYCIKPEILVDKIKKIGGPKNPNNDLILSLNPDLIIANIEENERSDIEFLEKKGICVFVTYPRTVLDSHELIKILGVITGQASLSKELYNDVNAEINTIKSKVEKIKVKSKFIYMIWRKPYMSINSDTYINDLLEFCGGENVLKDSKERYPEVSIDLIRKLSPDKIFLSSEPFPFKQKHINELLRHDDLKAVKNNQVRLVDGELLSWYGSRMKLGLPYAFETING